MKRYIAVIELDDEEEIVGDANISYTYRSNGTNYGTDESVELKADAGGLSMKTYEDGLNEAWEAARKVLCDSECLVKLEDIFDDHTLDGIFNTYTASEAIAKIKEYEEIKVGDEVVNVTGKKSVVVRVCGSVITLVESNGVTGRWEKEDFKKTGRHFSQIEEVLKQMQEGNE